MAADEQDGARPAGTATGRDVARAAGREFFLGILKAIENTCRITADIIDPDADDEPCGCGLTHMSHVSPLAGFFAGLRRENPEPQSDPDRPWTMTTARQLAPGYDVRLNSGQEYRVAEVGQIAVDSDGDHMISLHVVDSAGRPQVLRIEVDAPMLAAPRIPDDVSGMAP